MQRTTLSLQAARQAKWSLTFLKSLSERSLPRVAMDADPPGSFAQNRWKPTVCFQGPDQPG